LWSLRREELLQLIYLSGHDEVSSIVGHPSLSHQLHDIVSENIAADWSVGRLAEKLAVSESTLRRRLNAEGASIKSIVSRARLGQGLFLLQTTMEPIGRIAERCGYQSQSRFTDKFKQQFGLTPSELRKPGSRVKASLVRSHSLKRRAERGQPQLRTVSPPPKPYYQGTRTRPPKQHSACCAAFLRWPHELRTSRLACIR